MSRTLAMESVSQPQQQSSSNREVEDLQERIKLRAYELYEARGCAHGHHDEDWADAERQIREQGRLHQAA
jgi:hypothetical protein